MINYRKWFKGITIKSKASSESNELGDLEVLTSNNKVHFHNGTSSSPILTESHTGTISNKSIDADTNTITNIENADIKAGAAIDASKIADGSVSNAEFQYLANVTSDIQTQISAKIGNALTSANVFVGNGSNIATGVAVSGDITLSNAGVTAIGANKVVNGQLDQMAAHTFKGNNTASLANASDITSTQLTAELDLFSSTLKGLTPLSGGGTTNFLRADGTWASPAAGSYITALTSDVTASGPGSAAATIAANAVTNAKAAQMAAHTFKGNNTASTANASDLTVLQLTAELIIAAQAISASAIDWATGAMFTKTLAANTTFTFSNQVSGQTIIVRLTNTASNYTVTWPAVRWAGGAAPTMTVGAFSDVYTFIYDGSNVYGSAVQNMS